MRGRPGRYFILAVSAFISSSAPASLTTAVPEPGAAVTHTTPIADTSAGWRLETRRADRAISSGIRTLTLTAADAGVAHNLKS
jgi:hypothetical protein